MSDDKELHILKKDPNELVPLDFVRYFYNKCEALYGEDGFERLYSRDCKILHNIIEVFSTNSRPKLSIVHFVNWCVDRFQEKKLPGIITVPFMRAWVNLFLQLPEQQRKVYNHLKEVQLTAEQKRWIKEKKMAYKNSEPLFDPIEAKPKKSRSKKGNRNAKRSV